MKIKRKIKKRIQGSISILMIIVLLPTMVFSGVIVDSCRLNMARSMVSSAGDLAINSALADYDTILKDVYGLFAMSQAQTSDELAAEIQQYFEDTLVSYGVTTPDAAENYVKSLMGDFKEIVAGVDPDGAKNFMEMQMNSDLVVKKQDMSGLHNPQIMRKQIVDYMKYRAPVDFGLSFLDSVKAFTNVSEQSKVVTAQVQAQESLQPVTEGCRASIDMIREFDDLLIDIDSGTKAVTGLSNSADVTKVGIDVYHTQIDKYKETWGMAGASIGENYNNINQLNMVFLLKSPSVSDKYLSGMSYAAGDRFVTADGLNTANSGISVPYSASDDYDTVKNQVETQKAKLRDQDPYKKVKRDYYSDAFLKTTLLDYGVTKFTDRDAAIQAFIQFEGFLLDDTSKSTITYSEVKATLEELYILQGYHQKQIQLLDAKISAKKIERDQKKEARDAVGNEISQLETAIAEGRQAQQNKADLYAAWAAAYSDVQSKAAALSAANQACSSNPDNEQMQENRANAQIAYDVAVDNELSTRQAHEAAVAPTDAEISAWESDLEIKRDEYADLNAQYEALCQEVTALEGQKTLAVSQFKSFISGYATAINAYQHDLELYEDFKTVARKSIEKDAKAIQTQFKKIQTNVETINGKLGDIGVCLSNLHGYVKDYNDNVTAWDTANKTYEDNHSADSFSKQNAADISSTESQYNLASLETLQGYVQSLIDEYTAFYDYIMASDRYRYGSTRIDALSTADAVVNAVPADIKNSLPAIVSTDDANGKLDSLYADETTPCILIDNKTFLKPSVIPIQFLKYLNENFPTAADKKEIVVVTDAEGNPTDPEGEYDKIKDKMGTNEDGQKSIDEAGGTGYGYTFQSRGDLNKTTLPSYSKAGKTASTSSVKISSDADGQIDASTSVSKQSEDLGDVLGDVGKVLETGLENIYIVDYIFQNFSYNTMVQEMAVKGEGLTTYPQVMSLESHSNLNKYKGTAKTLSNYNITAANNYLYGGEVEYILFGNKNPKTNVKYTKASIYGIRFAFNTVFAFTDSEIRNTTMAAGLAVQAATLGFVPYQVVQIVLQLALAAAESAVDLDMMSKGLDVVVVKTRDTWSLSISGAIGMLTDTVAATAGDLVSDAITNAVTKVNEGINSVMEATTEELQGAVTKLTATVGNAAKSKGEEIVDSIYVELQNKIDGVLNQLQFKEFYTKLADGSIIYMSQDATLAEIDTMFEELKGGVTGITDKYAGNPIAEALLSDLLLNITGAGGVIDQVQNKVNAEVMAAYAAAPTMPDVGGKICGAMLQIKYDVINLLQGQIDDMAGAIEMAANDSIASITDELNTYAQQCVTETGEAIEESLTGEIKDKVVESLNNFSNTYLKDIETDSIDIGNVGADAKKGTSSKVASMIKFGYKDYLMLLMFITICVNDDAILARTADMIQLNMQNATGTPDIEGQLVFKHQKGSSFTLKEAKTYVSVEADVSLDMLLLDMEFFNRMLGDDSVTVQSEMDAGTTLHYKGVAGY